MSILFLGGDMRQKYACEFLNSNGFSSKVHLDFIWEEAVKSDIKSSSAVALPVPASKDATYLNMDNPIKIIDILNILNENQILFGGKLPETAKDYLNNKSIKYIDYFDIEAFQINNALLSAEGAIFYAKYRFESSVRDANIGILGFGRIGKLLSYLLRSQGAKISVYARKDFDLAWSRVNGINSFNIQKLGDTIDSPLLDRKYDIIFNTIPCWVMNEEFAKKVSDKTLIIDLASYPYGIDESLVHKYNLNYYRELGIPGRYAPKTAGEIIGKTIMNNMLFKED